ncbi:MAG: deoxyguanosinetriphosphate triphosphohydrolase [Proteobacteria bacterium]|nr:deoxyguanosinetriphosphate triphosphohydrolase [Pseudomonadota bacterium]
MRHLAPYASQAEQSRGRQFSHQSEHEDMRSHFQRDRDRIIHSAAFRKMKYKTQVFIYHEGDYFRTRLTHSLEVSQIARTISRHLRLDEDLAEAVALAHDLGHTPFGHAGETALDQLMEKYGGFDHNEQTARVLTKLEQCYAAYDGLNLTWETLEGVIKHNGPLANTTIRPTIAALDQDMKLRLDSYASLEAQIANLADDIAYLAHDCDDGIRAGLLDPDKMLDLPLAGPILHRMKKDHGALKTSRLVHELTRNLIKLAVIDLIKQTEHQLADAAPKNADDIRDAAKPMAAFSETMTKDLATLKDFLFAHVWRHYQVNRMTSKAKRLIKEMFVLFMDETNTLPNEWQYLDQNHLDDIDIHAKARQIADYIASMTDRFAVMEHKRLFAPGPILR